MWKLLISESWKGEEKREQEIAFQKLDRVSDDQKVASQRIVLLRKVANDEGYYSPDLISLFGGVSNIYKVK